MNLPWRRLNLDEERPADNIRLLVMDVNYNIFVAALDGKTNNFYEDDCRRVYGVIWWIYLKEIPLPVQGIITSDEACDALLRLMREND